MNTSKHSSPNFIGFCLVDNDYRGPLEQAVRLIMDTASPHLDDAVLRGHVVVATGMFDALRDIQHESLTDPKVIGKQHLEYLDRSITVSKVQRLDELHDCFEGFVFDTHLKQVYFYCTPSPSMEP